MTDITLADIPLARDIVPTDRRLLPCSLDDLNAGADIIQAAGGFVSKELRSDRGACVAVAYMAALHGTDLIGTASQAYSVGGRLAFMAQYINALVQRHLSARPVYSYQGAGATRAVSVTAIPKGASAVLSYNSPQIGQIKVKNSPLWVTDPDQQLSYYGIRAWSRRHMPDVLLGIYAVEELQSISIRDITPPPDPFREDDDTPDAPVEDAAFEPSGGFVTTDPDTFPGAAVLTGDAPEDDIIAWASGMKADAAEAATPDQLQRLWDGCEANRRKLWRTEKVEHDALEAAFKDRLADLS